MLLNTSIGFRVPINWESEFHSRGANVWNDTPIRLKMSWPDDLNLWDGEWSCIKSGIRDGAFFMQRSIHLCDFIFLDLDDQKTIQLLCLNTWLSWYNSPNEKKWNHDWSFQVQFLTRNFTIFKWKMKMEVTVSRELFHVLF